MTFNRDKAGKFRIDFEKAVESLEKQYGCVIELGTIRFDSNQLRAKMTAKIGEIVFMDHPKVPNTESFEILKINMKNIKLRSRDTNQTFNASPVFLKRS